MTRNWLFISAIVFFLVVTGCAADPEPPQAGPSLQAPTAGPLDPSGRWTGDWGPNERDRNPVTLDLKWDGTNLSGTVNPGENSIELVNTSFDPQTGAVKMEADVQSRGGVQVHYTIDGRVQGNTMTGSWSHDNNDGNFTITKN